MLYIRNTHAQTQFLLERTKVYKIQPTIIFHPTFGAKLCNEWYSDLILQTSWNDPILTVVGLNL
jgi:hypothetical protein